MLERDDIFKYRGRAKVNVYKDTIGGQKNGKFENESDLHDF